MGLLTGVGVDNHILSPEAHFLKYSSPPALAGSFNQWPKRSGFRR